MLHLRLRVPERLREEVVALLREDDTVTNIAVVRDGFVEPQGTLVLADVAREAADAVLGSLRELDLHRDGSITIVEADNVLSDAATGAEAAAPGLPEEGVVWDEIENRMRAESRLSWLFVAFLTLAALIAGAGRLLDQPILIVGAMVVGPEFSPIAAICVAFARPRLSLLAPALLALGGGVLAAVSISVPLWWLGYRLGAFTQAAAANGADTAFIVQPDPWSFAVSIVAGIAGVLSLTTAKSGPLVGVFISVTTVPAIGAFALSIGTANWAEAVGAATQLGINVTGLLLSGTATLLLQRLVWSRVRPPKVAHIRD